MRHTVAGNSNSNFIIPCFSLGGGGSNFQQQQHPFGTVRSGSSSVTTNPISDQQRYFGGAGDYESATASDPYMVSL